MGRRGLTAVTATPAFPAKAIELKNIEFRGDNITHEIIERFNSSFITIFDGEDINALARGLDGLMDEIEGGGARMDLIDVARPSVEGVALVEVIVQAAGKIGQAVARPKSLTQIRSLPEELSERERRAVEITRGAAEKPFNNGDSDILRLIK